MTKKEIVEDMARIMCDACPLIRKCESIKGCCVEGYAVHLYNAGYRKQSAGEWVDNARCGVHINGYMVCSVCDVMIPTCDNNRYCLPRLDYCPRCGAKMKGGE